MEGLRMGEAKRAGRRAGVVLWVVAFLLMAGAAVFQRLTGPTNPMRLRYEVAGESVRARLTRSGTTGEDERVEIPALPEGWSATLSWRRFPTDDPFTAVPMERDGDVQVALLPSQPAAGKVEYTIEVRGPESALLLPAPPEDRPVLRFKEHVPLYVLLPHILVMFLSMLFGVRAGLAAFARRPETRRLAWITLGGLTIGGLVLGPIAQKLAFGEYWTGWPNGYDLTDNKALIMWLVWLLGCLVLGRRAGRRDAVARPVVILAALVMFVVYLIPHSLRGSELDYDKLHDVDNPTDAIRTG